MLKYKFSLKEIILLLVATIIALGIFYYQIIVKDYNNAKISYDTTSIVDNTTILLAKANKMEIMKDYINSHDGDELGSVEVYNNLANEIDALSKVFDGKVENVSITYDDPYLTDNIVRRNASISFNASSYTLAKELIDDIASLQYRLIISQLTVSGNNNDSLYESDSISVSMQVTFFETTDGAENLSGLVVSE